MSTTETTARWVYPTDLGGNDFTFDNLLLAADELEVTRYTAQGDAIAVPPWSIEGVGDPHGGTVHFEENLEQIGGSLLVLERHTGKVTVGGDPADYIQDPAATRAYNNDQRLLIGQDLAEELMRTLHTSPIDTQALMPLPPAAERASRLLGFDPSGYRPVMYDRQPAGDTAAGDLPPGCIAAEVPGLPTRIWQNVHTASARFVRRVYQTGVNQIGVEFHMPHPYSAATQLYVRVYGCDGATQRAHRANNWSGGPLVDAVNCEPVAPGDPDGVRLGGDPWSITVLDATNVRLEGPNSIWKVAASDPDPVFLCGIAYADQVDAWPAVKAAATYIAGTPFSRLRFGAGFFFFLRNAGDLPDGGPWPASGQVDIPAFSSIEGVHPMLSVFARGDYFNSIPFRFQHSFITARNIGQWGDAPFSRAAMHGWKATAEDENRSIMSISYERVWQWAIPGYQFNTGHPGGKILMNYFDVRGWGSTNDFMDIKGEQDTNIDGAYANSIDGFFGVATGMGTVGSNKQVAIALGNNPIAITNGSGDFSVALPFKPYVGRHLMFDAAAPAAGNFAFAGRGFTVKTFVGTSAICSYDGGTTTATAASGAYGGAGRTILSPVLNKGKPLADLRSEYWRLSNALYIDVFGYSTGFRVRGGDGTNNNGTGGHRSVLSNIIAISIAHTADNTDGEAFKGLVILGSGVQVRNSYFNGNGHGYGISLQPGADGSLVDATVENCAVGIGWVGSNVSAKIRAIGCAQDVLVDGGKGYITNVLADALSINAGSSIVTLEWPAAPAGLDTGKSVLITGATPIGGYINCAGWHVVTKISAGVFTFDSGQVATETTVHGGGPGISVTSDLNVVTPNTGNKLELDSLGCTDTSLYITNRVAGFQLCNSSWDGAGAGIVHEPLATGLLLGPGNSGYDCAVPIGKLRSAAGAGRGARAMVTDAAANTFGSAVGAGGGSNVVPAWSDGTNWNVG